MTEHKDLAKKLMENMRDNPCDGFVPLVDDIYRHLLVYDALCATPFDNWMNVLVFYKVGFKNWVLHRFVDVGVPLQPQTNETMVTGLDEEQ